MCALFSCECPVTSGQLCLQMEQQCPSSRSPRSRLVSVEEQSLGAHPPHHHSVPSGSLLTVSQIYKQPQLRTFSQYRIFSLYPLSILKNGWELNIGYWMKSAFTILHRWGVSLMQNQNIDWSGFILHKGSFWDRFVSTRSRRPTSRPAHTQNFNFIQTLFLIRISFF